MFKEHIEAAERLLAQNRSRPVPMFEAQELAFFDAAIALMRAAEPKDESAEIAHAADVACELSTSDSSTQEARVVLRERAAARAEGYAAAKAEEK